MHTNNIFQKVQTVILTTRNEVWEIRWSNFLSPIKAEENQNRIIIFIIYVRSLKNI